MYKNILKNYGIETYDSEFIHHNHYVVYKITDSSIQKKYSFKILSNRILDIYKPRDLFEHLSFEKELLLRLYEKGVNVPKPVVNNKGEYLTKNQDVVAIMNEWVEGEVVSNIKNLSEENYYDIGQELANFHVIANKEFCDDKNKVLKRRRTISLDSLEELYMKKNLLNKKQYEMYKEVYSICDFLIEENLFLKKGVLHGDFQVQNIILNKEEIYFIDFSYYNYGYLVYDLVDFLSTAELAGKKAFLEGYESVFPEIHEIYYLLSGLIILSYINAYYIHADNSNKLDWIKSSLTKLDKLTETYFFEELSVIDQFGGIL